MYVLTNGSNLKVGTHIKDSHFDGFQTVLLKLADSNEHEARWLSEVTNHQVLRSGSSFFIFISDGWHLLSYAGCTTPLSAVWSTDFARLYHYQAQRARRIIFYKDDSFCEGDLVATGSLGKINNTLSIKQRCFNPTTSLYSSLAWFLRGEVTLESDGLRSLGCNATFEAGINGFNFSLDEQELGIFLTRTSSSDRVAKRTGFLTLDSGMALFQLNPKDGMWYEFDGCYGIIGRPRKVVIDLYSMTILREIVEKLGFID